MPKFQIMFSFQFIVDADSESEAAQRAVDRLVTNVSEDPFYADQNVDYIKELSPAGFITDFTTNEDYWDCNCLGQFIHPKSDTKCPKCRAVAEDQPDSRDNEIANPKNHYKP